MNTDFAPLVLVGFLLGCVSGIASSIIILEVIVKKKRSLPKFLRDYGVIYKEASDEQPKL